MDRSWYCIPRWRKPWRREPRRFYGDYPRAAPRERMDLGIGGRRTMLIKDSEWAFCRARDQARLMTGGSKYCPEEELQLPQLRWPTDTMVERSLEREPRGVTPRGTLRGGPARSAKEPQTPNKINTRQNTHGSKAVKGEQKSPKEQQSSPSKEVGWSESGDRSREQTCGKQSVS